MTWSFFFVNRNWIARWFMWLLFLLSCHCFVPPILQRVRTLFEFWKEVFTPVVWLCFTSLFSILASDPIFPWPLIVRWPNSYSKLAVPLGGPCKTYTEETEIGLSWDLSVNSREKCIFHVGGGMEGGDTHAHSSSGRNIHVAMVQVAGNYTLVATFKLSRVATFKLWKLPLNQKTSVRHLFVWRARTNGANWVLMWLKRSDKSLHWASKTMEQCSFIKTLILLTLLS